MLMKAFNGYVKTLKGDALALKISLKKCSIANNTKYS
jgi:hypothetical protein